MNITVTSPSKSSTVIMPYGLPLDFATRCCTLVTSPATVTWSPSLHILGGQQIVDAGRGVLRERDLEACERVVGHVEPEHLALERELVLLRPLRAVGHLGRRDLFELVVQAVEVEPDGAGRGLALGLDGGLGGVLVDLHQRAPSAIRASRTRPP